MNYRSLIILFIFWVKRENQVLKKRRQFFLSLLAIENLRNHLIFEFLILNFALKKKDWLVGGYFFSKFLKQLHQPGIPSTHQLALNGDCPRWVLAFLLKCCFKWRPRKCLGSQMWLILKKYFEEMAKKSENHKNFNSFHFLKNKI